jgi:hypothetical protein
MKQLLALAIVASLLGADWKRVAYLEYDAGRHDIAKEIAGMTAIVTATIDTESRSKVRTETKESVGPDGARIKEVETVRSGSKTDTLSVPSRKTSLLTIESWQDDDKKDKQYRMVIDEAFFMDVPSAEISKASRLCKAYVAALKKLAKGAKGKPYVAIQFGDKERGVAISHETKSKDRIADLTVRLWIKGKSFDLRASDGAVGFITDLAAL